MRVIKQNMSAEAVKSTCLEVFKPHHALAEAAWSRRLD